MLCVVGWVLRWEPIEEENLPDRMGSEHIEHIEQFHCCLPQYAHNVVSLSIQRPKRWDNVV